MTSARPGQSTSAVEVTNVSPHGFWLLVEQREYFVRFTDFPWFRDATIAELMRVELPSPASSVLARPRRRPGCRVVRSSRAVSTGEPRAADQALAADEGATAISGNTR